MKKLMGQKTTDKSNVQSLADKTTDGNVELLASKMNDFFVSVGEYLPRLEGNYRMNMSSIPPLYKP